MAGEKWKIGGVTVTRIVEIEMSGGLSRFLPDATREAVSEIPWLQPHFANADGRMRGSIHALIIDTGDACVVVDTCVGNDKVRSIPAWDHMQTGFLDDMADAGYPTDAVDAVLCTHLHVDHVGWNTRLEKGRWVPTFPNARYLIGADEFAFWEKRGNDEFFGPVFDGSVKPVFDAGLADLVAMDHRVTPEISLLPTPGHTPGHVSVLISSQGEDALITGDFLHHPCQIAHPEWCANVDEDSTLAEKTRREIFQRFADTPTLIIGTHFATPTAGRLVTDGDTYRLDV